MNKPLPGVGMLLITNKMLATYDDVVYRCAMNGKCNHRQQRYRAFFQNNFTVGQF